jgi:hypothetical protein
VVPEFTAAHLLALRRVRPLVGQINCPLAQLAKRPPTIIAALHNTTTDVMSTCKTHENGLIRRSNHAFTKLPSSTKSARFAFHIVKRWISHYETYHLTT